MAQFVKWKCEKCGQELVQEVPAWSNARLETDRLVKLVGTPHLKECRGPVPQPVDPA